MLRSRSNGPMKTSRSRSRSRSSLEAIPKSVKGPSVGSGRNYAICDLAGSRRLALFAEKLRSSFGGRRRPSLRARRKRFGRQFAGPVGSLRRGSARSRPRPHGSRGKRSRTGARYSTTASATAFLKSPYPAPSNSASTRLPDSGATEWMPIRLVMPSLPSPRFTSRPESVTALNRTSCGFPSRRRAGRPDRYRHRPRSTSSGSAPGGP